MASFHSAAYKSPRLLSQGLMFGYATDESPECMPVTILWAHRLNERLRELRTSGQFDWALPDSKTQVLRTWLSSTGRVIALLASDSTRAHFR